MSAIINALGPGLGPGATGELRHRPLGSFNEPLTSRRIRVYANDASVCV